MSDNALKLGTVPDETDQRDAVHVAIVPAMAAELLNPGERVGRLSDGRYGTGAAKDLGVVDPFRLNQVHAGERFWLCLFPGSITSLRHVWEHPALPEEK